ncbi:MAG: TolC family protein, partial [Candidatus Aminicenantes bacterium]|nr:TolC family protein [Candidatus Aminicenantes bacterium]
LIVFMSGLLLASEEMELTIDRAIKLALKNNTRYLISQQEVKQSKLGVQKNLGFLPRVSLEGYRVLDEKLMELEMPSMVPGEDPIKMSLDFTKNYEFTLQVVQPVFTGGKIWYAFKNAQIDLRIAREKLRNSKEDLILNVKKVFFNILVMKELLKTHEQALQLAENNYQNVKESFELGMVSKYDLLQAELSMSSQKPRILNIKKLIEIMTSNLKVMAGIPDPNRIQVIGELNYHKKQLELSHLIQNALIKRSEILQLEMEVKKTGNILKMTWAQFIPDFSIIARYSYRSDYLNFKPGNWEDYYTINLGISFPIFTGLRRGAEVGQMRVLKKILKMNLKELSDATRVQVKDLHLTMKEEYENILLGVKNMETAGEGVRIAELSYQEGLITILELNSSYNALTQARVSYLQAIYNYNIALATLEKISGVTINGGTK